MKYFTPEDALSNSGKLFSPREQTLNMIRQIAYTYRRNPKQACCLN